MRWKALVSYFHKTRRFVVWEEMWLDYKFLVKFFWYFPSADRVVLAQVCRRWREVSWFKNFSKLLFMMFEHFRWSIKLVFGATFARSCTVESSGRGPTTTRRNANKNWRFSRVWSLAVSTRPFSSTPMMPMSSTLFKIFLTRRKICTASFSDAAISPIGDSKRLWSFYKYFSLSVKCSYRLIRLPRDRS